MTYREYRRSVELLVRDRVFDALREEGSSISDVREPDILERRRRAADFDFLLDGERVALEVTEFQLRTEDVQAEAGTARASRLIRDRLSPLAAELGLGLVAVAFDYRPGEVPSKRRMEAAIQPFVAAIATAMRALSDHGTGPLDVADPVPWATNVSVIAVSKTEASRVATIVGAHRDHLVDPVVREFVMSRISSKEGQTAGYGRAILGVFKGWIVDADDLKRAFAATSPVPWWRIYLADNHGAELVHG